MRLIEKLKTKTRRARLSLMAQLIFALTLDGHSVPAVSGRVLDPGGYPLRDATVTLRNLSGREDPVVARTNPDGSFNVEEILDGDYSVEVNCRSFMTISMQPVHIEFPRGFRRDFRLELCCVQEGGISARAELVGRLTYLQRSLPGATICLAKQGAQAACTESNGLGQYFLSLEPGSYDASVTFRGKLVWKQSLELSNPGPYRDALVIALPLSPIRTEDTPGKSQ
jgi:hypothetical protein